MLWSPENTNGSPAIAMSRKIEAAPAPPSDNITPQLQMVPAPGVAARSALRKHSKPLPAPPGTEIAPPEKEHAPPEKELVPLEKEVAPPEKELAQPSIAPKQFTPRPAAGVAAFMAAKTGLSRSRVLWNVRASIVERSLDGGITWQPVPIREGSEFTAVASNSADVWAGGAHGLLFHSSDAGSSWTQVDVEGAHALTGAIVSIRLPAPSEVILETDSGEQWISRDGGASWKGL